jgi:glycosyltransferase involved in cell wall biosynthesis
MSNHQTLPPGPDGPFLSIIIPAYNEESRIVDTLGKVVDYLGSQTYTWELVVVDDGSTDNTASLVRPFAQDHSGVELVRVAHGGKGWAVNQGMLWTKGEYRFLCDADLSMPIEHLSRFLSPSNPPFDVAIGSREAPGARRIGEPHRRHFMGRAYNLLVRLLAVSGLADTQCGFKCFSAEAAQDLFRLQKLHGFAFDVEILFLARKRGYRIREVPIDWYYRSQSKVRPFKDSLTMSRDIIKVRWHYFRGKYKYSQ